MNFKSILKELKNFRWIRNSVKPFYRKLTLIIVCEATMSLGGVLMAVASKNLIDNAVESNINRAALFAAMFGGIILFNMIVNAFISVYSVRTLEQYQNLLRQDIFSKLINMEWLQVSKYHSGDLLTRLTSDIGTVANGSINLIPQMIALSVQLAAAFFTLLNYEPSLAFLAFILAPFTILISRLYGKKLKNMHLKIQETESSYRSHMQEFLQNILVLKTFNMEERSKDKVDELQKERLKWVTERSKTGVIANSILSLGYWIGYFLAFGWGAIKLSNKTASFGTLTAFLQLVNQIQGPFIGLSRTVPQIISAFASAGRLIELENNEMEEKDLHLELPGKAGIRFKNVHYSYDKEENILSDVSMEVLPGETIALTGTSGEGKTTMLRLIFSLLKPDKGNIVYINESLSEKTVSSATRNLFSYVPQGNTLFSGTIRENMLAGYEKANTNEIKEALKIAEAFDFVEKLAEGIDTLIGEKAHGLSEGQAQRIAIARAILRKSPILVFDEATSALDMEVEKKILQNIKNLNPQRTCIMITHRKTAFDICDKIYRLKDGILYEDGII